MSGEEAALARAWLAAACDPAIAAGLESVYEYVAAAVESRGPACWASGRCCNFEKTGHRLYVTGLEAAYTVVRLGGIEGTEETGRTPEAGGAGETGVGEQTEGKQGMLTQASLERAIRDGGCPFQVANLCGVHAIRPLGCRVYFCDRSSQRWQEELSERTLARIRAIHDHKNVPYRYGEWRGMLGMLLGEKPGAG